MLNEKFETVETKISDMGLKFDSEIMDIKARMNHLIKFIEDSLRKQTNEIQNALFLSESSIRTDLNATSKVIGKGLVYTKESFSRINSKIEYLEDGRDRKSRISGEFIPQPVIPDPLLPQSNSGVELQIPDSAGSSKSNKMLIKPYKKK